MTKKQSNRTTHGIRLAFQKLLDKNIDKVDGWLDEIAKTDPVKACEILLKMSDFVLPKLKSKDYDDLDKDIDQVRIDKEKRDKELNKGLLKWDF